MDESIRDAAILRLGEWLGETETSAEDWQITPFEDAVLFAPAGGRRSNRLFLVRGASVVAFSPATMSFDDAYSTLVPPETAEE